MTLKALAVSCCLALSAAAAPPAAADVEQAPATRWYGWQLMLTDAASLALAVGDLSHDWNVGPALYVGGAGYVLGGPVIHLVHGRPAASAGSVALRVLVPLAFGAVGAVIGQASTSGNCRECPGAVAGAAVGAGLGGLTALVIDWAALSHEEIAPPSGAPRLSLAASRNGLRLVGRF